VENVIGTIWFLSQIPTKKNGFLSDMRDKLKGVGINNKIMKLPAFLRAKDNKIG